MWWNIINAIALICVAVLVPYFQWRNQSKLSREIEKFRTKHNTDMEELKAEYTKKQTVHRVQFEREFRIYRKLWEAITEVNAATLQVLSKVSLATDKTERTIAYMEKTNKCYDTVSKLYRIIIRNSPFYSRGIWTLCKDLGLQLTEYIKQSDANKIDAAQMGKLTATMSVNTNAIENAIRERIGNAEIIE